MNVDRARVRIRERAPTEVLDLTFVFLKRNAALFGALAALLVIPAALIVALAARTYVALSWYVAFVGCMVMDVVIRAPVVLACGQVMFSDRVRLGGVLADLRRHLPVVVSLVGRRALLALTVVGVLLDWFGRYHADEVLLLERLDGAAAQTRLRHLRRRFGSQCQEQLVHHLFLGTVAVVSAVSVWVFARMIFSNESVEWWPKNGGDVAFVAAVLAVQVYFAAAKFLFYLNLRTVNEGWDLFLETRAIESLLERRRPRAGAPRLTRPVATDGAAGGAAGAPETAGETAAEGTP